MNPANIPAENLPTRKRGRKRAPFDPIIREIVAEMEVRGTTLSDAAGLIAGNDEYAEKARYAHRRIVKPDAPSTDRQLPLPVMCREAILDENYQLCGACGEAILNNETCVVAPVLAWGSTQWLLYFHPVCALDPSSWTKKIYAAMREMDRPCEFVIPDRARRVFYDPLLRSLVDFFLQPRASKLRRVYGLNFDKNARLRALVPFIQPEYSKLRTLTFVPFPDGNTRESVERSVDVLECDGFTSLHDEKYCRAQFQIMYRACEEEISTDEAGLDHANLVRLSGGCRRVVTQDTSSDDERSSTKIAVPVLGPVKSGHPVFQNSIETKFVQKIDAGTLGREAKVAREITAEEIEKIVIPERQYKHAPVFCGTDQRTAYRRWGENDKARKSRAHFVTEYDSDSIPGEYPAYSRQHPERHDNGDEKSDRSEFEYFMLERQVFLGREKGEELYGRDPRGKLVLLVGEDEKIERTLETERIVPDERGVDKVAARMIEQIKRYREEWKSRLPGDGRVSFSKWMPNERPRLKVSAKSGKDTLEAALAAKWLELPGQTVKIAESRKPLAA